MELAIRDATRDDYDALCALNTASVAHTSPMDPARVETLDVLSCYHRVAEGTQRVSLQAADTL